MSEPPTPPNELELILIDIQYSLPLQSSLVDEYLQSYLSYFESSTDISRDDISIKRYLELRAEIAHRWKSLTQDERLELIPIYNYIKRIDALIRMLYER